jgi:hypothetical protein
VKGRATAAAAKRSLHEQNGTDLAAGQADIMYPKTMILKREFGKQRTDTIDGNQIGGCAEESILISPFLVGELRMLFHPSGRRLKVEVNREVILL